MDAVWLISKKMLLEVYRMTLLPTCALILASCVAPGHQRLDNPSNGSSVHLLITFFNVTVLLVSRCLGLRDTIIDG